MCYCGGKISCCGGGVDDVTPLANIEQGESVQTFTAG